MDRDLETLEQKVTQLIAFCQRLREENHRLRQALAQEQDENKRLAEKVESARNRLVALLERIPS